MKKYINIILLVFLIIILVNCKKSTPAAPAVTTAKCTIKTENTGLAGNQKSFVYELDAQGNPNRVETFYPTGGSAGIYEIGSQSVVFKRTTSAITAQRITKYNVSDITKELPTEAYVSLDDGFVLRVNYYHYFFFYNAKKQLIKVGENTETIIGDNEYDLNIIYNAEGNVSALQYEWTTGPNEVIPPVVVTAWDDKPTPYASIKSMPFLLINYAWDNYDPEPLLTALSKNNPLNFSRGSGSDLFTRTMLYQYNIDGFPIERKNTNKNANGEYTFLQTFTYDCN
jgi:hypothetical protein